MKYQDHLNLNQPFLYPKIKKEEWEKILSYIQSYKLDKIYKEMANIIKINSLIGAGNRTKVGGRLTPNFTYMLYTSWKIYWEKKSK